MTIGIYPGSFDPITNGHSDIIVRAAEVVVDKLIVAVAHHSLKPSLFSIAERIGMIEATLVNLPQDLQNRIEVQAMQGLLIDFAESQGAHIIIRGLRAVSDFEYEFQMTAMNHRLQHNTETLFLMASEHHHFVSSRFVKEIASLGGDISSFVDAEVVKRTMEKYNR